MATRYTIGKVQEDGVTIRSVYGHWDGYPSYAGKMLRNFYTDEKKIDRLLDLGDLSVLDTYIGGSQKKFKKRRNGWSFFYGRDRGEDGVSALVHANTDEWFEFRKGSWCEYAYMWDGREWHTFNLTEKN